MLVTEAIYKSHLYIKGSSLTLDEFGINMLTRNVSIQLQTHAAVHPRRPTASTQRSGSLTSGKLNVFNSQLLSAGNMLMYQNSEY